MALTAAQKAEIERKAILNKPLSNKKDKEADAYYKQIQKELSYTGPSDKIAQPKDSPQVVVTTVDTGDAERAARETAKAEYTGWDNDPQVRAIQEKSWAIFIATGRWDTPEQIALHKTAEDSRIYNNPMYPGSPWGPLTWIDAEKITPRGTTPGADSMEGAIDGLLDPAKFGSYMKMFFGGVFLLVILSFFRR